MEDSTCQTLGSLCRLPVPSFQFVSGVLERLDSGPDVEAGSCVLFSKHCFMLPILLPYFSKHCHASQAFQAVHSAEPFWIGGESFDSVVNYVQLKIRQMAAKIRNLVSSHSDWEAFSKKITKQQHEIFVRLCRCIDHTFLTAEHVPEPSVPSSSYEAVAAVAETAIVPFERPHPDANNSLRSWVFWLEGNHFLPFCLCVIFSCNFHFLHFQFQSAEDNAAREFLHQQPASFFQLAEYMASEAANQALVEPDCEISHVSQKKSTKTVTKQPENKKGTTKTVTKKDNKMGNTKTETKKQTSWWKAAFGANSEHEALKQQFKMNQKDGRKMDMKNFASRIYHKVDDHVGRTCAREAHQAALTFWKGAHA